MADANEQLVRDGYAAFSAGDMEKLGSLYTDDVVQSVPGNNQIAADHQGRDAVLGYYGKLFELTDGNMSVQLKTVTVDGDKVAAVHANIAERNGKKLDSDTTLNFTIKDGKITRIDEVSSDQAAEDAFWGQA